MSFKFEQLEIWQQALEISDKVFQLTKTFPREEVFVLTTQMRRAADSISLNIAEGSTGQSDAEQTKFLGYAQRSGIEVVGCLYLARKRGYLTDTALFDALYKDLNKIVSKIQAFKNAISSMKRNKP